MNKLLIFIVLSLFVIQLQSKVITETISLTKFRKEGGFHYISKMAMDIGSGTWTFRARFNKKINLPANSKGDSPIIPELVIYLDDEWENLDHKASCSDKLEEQRTHKNKKEVNLIPEGNWTPRKSGTVSQSQQRRVWFFALAECEMSNIQELIDANRYAGIKIEIELTLKNNYSHFGSDEIGFILPITFLLLVTVAGFAYGLFKMIKSSKSGDDFDWALFLVLLAMGFQIFFLFFELIHQLTYKSNGKGLYVLQLLGQLCEVVSQFTLSCFLLLVSWGWTINYMEMDSFDVIIPLGVLVGILHMMIMGLGKITDNAHYKYHSYDGWQGYVIFIIRIGIFVYFIFGIKDTLKKANNKLQDFVRQLSVFGALYILAFPILLIISWFCAYYVRNIVITIGTLLVQTIAFVVLIYLNTSQKSSYYKVSYKAQTVLPNSRF